MIDMMAATAASDNIEPNSKNSNKSHLTNKACEAGVYSIHGICRCVDDSGNVHDVDDVSHSTAIAQTLFTIEPLKVEKEKKEIVKVFVSAPNEHALFECFKQIISTDSKHFTHSNYSHVHRHFWH